MKLIYELDMDYNNVFYSFIVLRGPTENRCTRWDWLKINWFIQLLYLESQALQNFSLVRFELQ